MALFGALDVIAKQIDPNIFEVAFHYLKNVSDAKSQEYRRLFCYADNTCEKIILDHRNFVLEQSYRTKERSSCFFESHQTYIDVQFIVEGEEIMEVVDTRSLHVKNPYDPIKDVTIYEDVSLTSSLLVRKGDVAIFFPEDAHMPCIQSNHSTQVIKTVVKVRVW